MKTILDGGFYYEAPRWHYGRLWFVDCMARTLLSVSPTGDAREHASFDDTPCGRLLIRTMFRKRLHAFADGRPEGMRQLKSSSRIDVMAVDIPRAGSP